jgi:hypothetical protein
MTTLRNHFKLRPNDMNLPRFCALVFQFIDSMGGLDDGDVAAPDCIPMRLLRRF